MVQVEDESLSECDPQPSQHLTPDITDTFQSNRKYKHTRWTSQMTTHTVKTYTQTY